MISRRLIKTMTISALGCCLALATVAGLARAQYGNLASRYGSGYGSTPYGGYGGYGASAYGYGTGTGRIGSGYQGAGQLYYSAYRAARPQTTTDFQPLYSLITELPGWNAPVHRTRRRIHSQPSAPLRPPFDDKGKIVWPSTVPDDPGTASLRRAAEKAVTTVVDESNSTGHGSVRLVVDAKNKLSSFEEQVLPAVRAKNSTDGAALERFFEDIDRALDALTYRY